MVKWKQVVQDLGDNVVCILTFQEETLIVVDNISINVLNIVRRHIKGALVLRKKEIIQGSDVLALQLLHIKLHRELLFGYDVFADITLHKKDLRLATETELRTKLIALTSRYIQKPAIKPIIQDTIPALQMLLEGLCAIKMMRLGDIPTDELQLIERVEQLYEIKLDTLKKIYKKRNVSIQEIITTLTSIVDHERIK